MPRKKADMEPLMGEADIARRVEQAGLDAVNEGAVNADLDLTKEIDRPSRSASAVALRLSGASHTDIARVLGYSSPTHARQAIERVLASAADSPEDLKTLRVLQTRRYERLLQSVMSKAVDPEAEDHLAYNSRAMTLVDRISKLHGVDAPTQVQFTPTDEYLTNYTNRLLEAAGLGTLDADEASPEDIEDAEIIGDDEGLGDGEGQPEG